MIPKDAARSRLYMDHRFYIASMYYRHLDWCIKNHLPGYRGAYNRAVFISCRSWAHFISQTTRDRNRLLQEMPT